jgi:hypothetical protein
LKVGREVSADDFKKIAASNNWSPPTVPFIFYRTGLADSWKPIGGYEALVKYFEERK